MSKKLISLVSATILVSSLSGCGYQGHYRYPCQDPANWESAECKPPLCEGTGTCTKDIFGYDPLATESDTIGVDVVEETTESEIVEVEE